MLCIKGGLLSFSSFLNFMKYNDLNFTFNNSQFETFSSLFVKSLVFENIALFYPTSTQGRSRGFAIIEGSSRDASDPKSEEGIASKCQKARKH